MTLTVQEIIEELKKFPSDARVYVNNDEYDLDWTKAIEVSRVERMNTKTIFLIPDEIIKIKRRGY